MSRDVQVLDLDSSGLLTERDAAARAGVGRSTWASLVARGLAPTADTRRRWRPAAIAAWTVLGGAA